MIFIKTEILYGLHPVSEAMAAGRRIIHEIYLAKEKRGMRIDDVVRKSQSLKIPVTFLSMDQIQSLAGKDSHQGIAAKVSPYPVLPLRKMMDAALERTSHPFFLLLDHVVDPHNLGALIRTALCVGVHGVVIPKDRSATPSPVVSKISAGALEHISLAQAVNMVYAILDLKKNGVWIAGLDKNGRQSLFETDLTGAIGLVVGAEEKGIAPLIKKHCDFLMFIPQGASINSLNASVAGGVAMYEAFRQRNQ